MLKKLKQRYESWKLARDIRAGRVLRGRQFGAQRQEGAGVPALEGRLEGKACLSAVLIRKDGTRVDYGVVSRRVVTDAFVQYVIDAMQDSSTYPLDVFKYHASGTGATAEAASDTALVSEVESRVVGTQTEGSAANVYKTVATISYTSSHTITEHGVFSASTGGTLLDRSVFTGIAVASGDSIQFTYEFTLNSGG